MFYVYLLQSEKDDGYYIGYTSEPERRLVEHQNGLVESTRHRRPVRMIYVEGYVEEHVARERERSLKNFGSAYTALIKRLTKKEQGGLV